MAFLSFLGHAVQGAERQINTFDNNKTAKNPQGNKKQATDVGSHVFNFLSNVANPLVGAGESIGKQAGDIATIGANVAKANLSPNIQQRQNAQQLVKKTGNEVAGDIQAIPRGIVSLRQSAAHLIDPNNPTTGDVTPANNPLSHAILGTTPIPTLQNTFSNIKKQSGSTTQAVVGTGLSAISDVAGGAGLAKGALKAGEGAAVGAKAVAENTRPLNEIGAIGKDVNPNTDIHIPIGDTGNYLRVSNDEMNKLVKAQTPEQVKSIIGDALPQDVTNRIAPSLANTHDPHIISNVIGKNLAPPKVDTSVAPAIAPTPEPSPETGIKLLSDVANKSKDFADFQKKFAELPDHPDMNAAVQQVSPHLTQEEFFNSLKQGQVPASSDVQRAVDRATQPVDTGRFTFNPDSKNFKKPAEDIRSAYSGEKNAQQQAASVLTDTLKKAAPNEQSGIFWYREAKGNPSVLTQWLDNPDPKLDPYREDIQQALHLSPEAKGVSSALDTVYERAGKNAFDQGTLNSVLNDYNNTRLYKRDDSSPSIGRTLRQTAQASKSRVYSTAADAVLNGHELATTNAADVAGVHLADLARANATNSLFKNVVDSGLGKALHAGEDAPRGMVAMGSLRALARDEKNQRINLYSQAKDLRPIQNKAERLVAIRQSWVRNLSGEINRLNKQGLDVALSKSSDKAETGTAFKYLEKDTITNAETTAKSRGVKNIGAAGSVTGQLRSTLTPGVGASVKETRNLINDLVNLPSGKIEAIKSKIATRENKLGPIIDHITELKNQIDSVKADRQNILDQAREINSPTRIAVPEDLAKRLGAITDGDLLKKVDGVRKIAAYQGLVKTVDLSLSLFHAITFVAQAVTNTKFGTELLRNGTEFLDKINSPEFADSEYFFHQAGGLTTKGGELQDITRNLSSTGTKSLLGKTQDLPGIKQFLQGTDKFTSLLFDKGQRWLKVTDFTNKFENYASKHPEATPEELTQVARGYAKEVNATYGGLNWEQMGISKTQQSFLRFVLLAPDWVVSNISLGKYAVSDTGVAGKAARAQLFNALSTGMVTTQILNKAITGHYTNENPKGHEFDIQIAPNVYISVFRGGPGELVKVFQGIQDKGLAQGTAGYLQGKASPLARTAIGLGSGKQFTGQPISKPGGSFAQKSVDEAKYLAQSALPVPIGVSGAVKYANNAKSTHEPVNPLIAASLGTGVSRFTKTNNNLSTREQAVLSQLQKQGANKQEVNAVTQFYLTTKAAASGKAKVNASIDAALANNDTAKAQSLADAYNQKYAAKFKGWVDKYGTYSNPGLEKAYTRGKINLSDASIKSRQKSISNNPIYAQ